MVIKKLTTMLSIVLLVGCASTEVKKSVPQQASFTNAQISSLLVGKSMIGYEGWSDTFNPDGTVDSIHNGGTSKGKYMIKDGLLCTMFINNRCRSISKTANGYYAKSVSGGGRSFKFTVK